MLPFPSYKDGIPSYSGYGFATVEGSRGCYHNCTFCLPAAFYRQRGVPYRMRSIVNLVDEIESLYRQGARLFLFDDEQFLPPPHLRSTRVAALSGELARRKLNIAFTIKCRADEVDTALFAQLKQLGLIRVYIGIESGCQASLDLFDKRTTVQQNVAALQTLDELGLIADFRMLMFHPWSTLVSIEADLVFIEAVLPYVPTLFDFREVEVYLGTPLAERLRVEGRGTGEPWCPNYTIAEPGAELLRRLNRVITNPAGVYAQQRSVLTQVCYDHLLRARFQTADPEGAQQLKNLALHVNGTILQVYREMLVFVREGDIYDAGAVNAYAAGWVGHINEVCTRASR